MHSIKSISNDDPQKQKRRPRLRSSPQLIDTLPPTHDETAGTIEAEKNRGKPGLSLLFLSDCQLKKDGSRQCRCPSKRPRPLSCFILFFGTRFLVITSTVLRILLLTPLDGLGKRCRVDSRTLKTSHLVRSTGYSSLILKRKSFVINSDKPPLLFS